MQQCTLLSAHTLKVMSSKMTYSALKNGKRCGIWTLIPPNARSFVSLILNPPLRPSTFLDSVSSAKYLGVTISDDLSWITHIDNITKSANQTLGFLKRNIRVHNKDLKSVEFKTLVRPQLEYASTVWSPKLPLINRKWKRSKGGLPGGCI